MNGAVIREGFCDLPVEMRSHVRPLRDFDQGERIRMIGASSRSSDETVRLVAEIGQNGNKLKSSPTLLQYEFVSEHAALFEFAKLACCEEEIPKDLVPGIFD